MQDIFRVLIIVIIWKLLNLLKFWRKLLKVLIIDLAEGQQAANIEWFL